MLRNIITIGSKKGVVVRLENSLILINLLLLQLINRTMTHILTRRDLKEDQQKLETIIGKESTHRVLQKINPDTLHLLIQKIFPKTNSNSSSTKKKIHTNNISSKKNNSNRVNRKSLLPPQQIQNQNQTPTKKSLVVNFYKTRKTSPKKIKKIPTKITG